MSQEIQLRGPDRLPEAADPFAGFESQGPPQPAGFAKLHRLLKRRYKWCILLGLVLAAAGAAAGWLLPKRQWVATGTVQIRFVVQPILGRAEENGPYEPFVQSQVALLKSQRVIQMAMSKPEWKQCAPDRHGSDPRAVADFRDALQVSWIGRSELIGVSFTDPDRQIARTAVAVTLAAYDDIRQDMEALNTETRNKVLLKKREDLAVDRNSKRAAILRLAKDDPKPVYQLKMQELARLESSLNEVDVMLAGLAPTTRPAEAMAEATALVRRDPATMTLVEIASVDAHMDMRLRDLEAAKIELERLKAMNLGPQHPQLLALKVQIEQKEKLVQEYAASWRKAAAGNPEIVRNTGEGAELSFAQLSARRQQLIRAIRDLRMETEKKGQDIAEIDRLKREEEQVAAEYQKVDQRIEQLDIEAKNQPRVSVYKEVDAPLIAKDSRIQMTGFGGGVGLLMGFVVIATFSAVDRRLRGPDDMRAGPRKLSLLGVLPSLPENLADPEQAAIASHCVHQIRTLLQIGAGSPERCIFAITSPAAGTGKTSLTLSLGVSFAASNSRTLMIDCDLVGGGLTARVEAIIRRKIGQIFVREGLITPQQLDAALRQAYGASRKIGEVLVELGYLSHDDVSRALNIQEQFPVGVLDALGGEKIEECIAETGIQNLAILPLGAARPMDISKLSPASIRALLQRAREHYDTILIDTGPVPGSLEASVVAAAAESVVLVVSRGEHRPMAERSIQHLNEIGARVAGLVFNRAQSHDVEMSGTNHRMSSIARGVRPGLVVEDVQSTKFGPVARAVASNESDGSTRQ